ncbi:NUDIX domain-containing protein [Porphyromonas levii]|uniref:NUDIX domain-containing protein n=1 Tax=Porphyromonas levii TaxID=28114 RepID=UPI001BACE166|nr:NUDIX domain-containing protein [Porphyromonas levii]MBR8702843.1 NADH pyrophosphatase [Porphyromonas levii]MBR8763302.1 NADH pyrophosphatase [Porphyromonas levii]MBR8784128.1 NADH pyrophosphatase [Porphyromonas levii]
MEEKHPLEDFKYCPKCGSVNFVEQNDKAKHCNDCGFTYYFNPSTASMCFITDRYYRVLVAVRGEEPAKGSYDLPGGFVDCFETVEEGMAREIREETRIDAPAGTRAGVISPLKYLFSLPNIYRYSEFDVHTVDMVFHMAVESLDPYVGIGRDDVAELKAIPFAELNPEDFGLDSVRKAVEMVRADRYF